MQLRSGLFLFICILSAGQTLTAQDKKAVALDKYFSGLAKNQQFSGNVLIAENGKVIYERSFGYSDFTNHTPNTKNTVFPIASLSKTLTATGILQLAQKGKIAVTDPVVKYLPEFPYPAITIRHLLSHTSGLPPYNAYFDNLRTEDPDRVFTNVDFMQGLVKNERPLLYEPGESGNYDNINFIVLALLLEKVSGMPYRDYIKKNILEPAGMSHTVFFPLKQQYEQATNPNFAFPHLYPHLYSDSLVRANTVPYIVSYWHGYEFSGFGDYISTTADLLKYDEAYYDGSLLDARIFRDAFTPAQLNNGRNNPGNFGWGWEIETDTTLGRVVYHSGAATGLSCILMRNVSRHQTVIVYDNLHYTAHETAAKALKILNGVPVPNPKKSIAGIYARELLSKGPDVARATLYRLREDRLNYQLSEDEMNSIGYDFLGGSNNPNPYHFPEEHKYREAVEIFKLNMQLFPDSWNVYDSYGEALLKTGDKEEAIKMYKRSIELNPKNEGGRNILKKLLK
jgi:CubicO group peptidase (beta-lactamase class C family)